jgi:20S proteasome subunit beta 2
MEVTDKFQARLMALDELTATQTGGFNFDLYQINKMITQDATAKGHLPSAWKTGTTIVGMIYKDGIVLGADTRATGGSEVVDKVFFLFVSYI